MKMKMRWIGLGLSLGLVMAFSVQLNFARADECTVDSGVQAEAEADLQQGIQDGEFPEGAQVVVETVTRVCGPAGFGCRRNSDCCNNNCNVDWMGRGRCAFGSGPGPGSCNRPGQACRWSFDCCSNRCTFQRCR